MLIGSGAGVARGQAVLTGSTDGGAFYMIAVPEPWNGDLVIWNHGFDLDPVAPLTDLEDLGPLAPVQLAQGYAVAASSYQQTGWAVFKTKNDLQNLANVFKDSFGPPNQIFLVGASLGGAVTAAAIEQAHVGKVAGALTICGAVGGSRNWDGALDLRLIYDAVCGSVPGAFIPGGAEGLPGDFAFSEAELAFAVNACTGVLLPPTLRTPEQSDNLARILEAGRIPENFLVRDMGFATFGLSDLVHDPAKLDGQIGTGNADVVYEDGFIEDFIERVSPNPGARNRLARHFTPSGVVGDTRIVSLHTDKDGLVVVENESAYAAVVPPGNLTTAIVVEQVPSHCGFTDAEGVAAWESLRGWVAGAPQPTASDIQFTCGFLEATMQFDGPCRIDPGFVVPAPDERLRPR
jgi:hypothetical protein